jgi:hypothetical protein
MLSKQQLTILQLQTAFFILLQAVVDADFKLIAADIGAAGCQSDGGNFISSSLFHLLEKGELNVPPDYLEQH